MEPIRRFLHVEALGGVVLLTCALVAIILANSRFGESYLGFWDIKLGLRLGSLEVIHSLKHWINDGLMCIFFFLVGLEVKRELVLGELREPRKAMLPIAAAVGGMVAPAVVYLVLQWGEPSARGWGIPMATDIAFVVGAMAILGSRIPHVLRIMVLSLAIVDDIGAIVVIAVGYTSSLHLPVLLLGLLGILVVETLARLGVRSFAVYTAVGAFIWFAFHESGVHATIAGVILGLMTPATSYLSTTSVGSLLARASQFIQGGEFDQLPHRADAVRAFLRTARESISPLEYLEGRVHPWVTYLIMPLFALANAGVVIQPADMGSSVALAVSAGLVLGKPLGILAASWLTVRLILKTLPQGLSWGGIIGASCLAGVGFTMSLFIAALALQGNHLTAAKVGILAGSATSAVLGMALLWWLLPSERVQAE